MYDPEAFSRGNHEMNDNFSFAKGEEVKESKG
jgi:hypothetical protein